MHSALSFAKQIPHHKPHFTMLCQLCWQNALRDSKAGYIPHHKPHFAMLCQLCWQNALRDSALLSALLIECGRCEFAFPVFSNVPIPKPILPHKCIVWALEAHLPGRPLTWLPGATFETVFGAVVSEQHSKAWRHSDFTLGDKDRSGHFFLRWSKPIRTNCTSSQKNFSFYFFCDSAFSCKDLAVDWSKAAPGG